MGQDRLITFDSNDGYFRIAWYIAEWDDIGSWLGDGVSSQQLEAEPSEPESLVWYYAEKAAQELKLDRDRLGYRFETATAADRNRRLINARRKQLRDKRPWPDWANTALAAGWKPPKGWQP